MFNRALDLDGRVHRKDFEWTQCIYGLETLGALGPTKEVLGVGAGRETVLYYLANRAAHTVALDLYEGKFSDWEAVPDFPENPGRYAPFPYRPEALRGVRGDGRTLPFPDGSFDVVYSLGSIEHFGGHHAATQSMREMRRVLRPGGVICIATEWILEGGDHFEYFTPADIYRHLVDEPGLELVEPIDETPPPRDLVDNPVWIDGDISVLPHVVMGEGSLRWTSVVMFLRKPSG